MCPGVWLEAWLRWFAHPFGGGVCRAHAQYPAFAPNPLLLFPAFQKWQLGFWGFFVSVVQNLPQLHMYTVIFSTQGDICPGESIAALQQRVPGPSLFHFYKVEP